MTALSEPVVLAAEADVVHRYPLRKGQTAFLLSNDHTPLCPPLKHPGAQTAG